MLLRFAIGVGFVAYLAKSGIVDFRAVSKVFTYWRITLTALSLLLVDTALMSVRLSWLFRPQALNVRFGTSLKLALVGFFFGTFFPGAAGGDLSKLFYTTRGSGGSRAQRIDVEKSASHHLFQNEIAGDNPCSQQLSEAALFRAVDT